MYSSYPLLFEYTFYMYFFFQETLWPIYFVIILIIVKQTGFKTTLYPEVLTTYSSQVFAHSLIEGSTLYYSPNTPQISRQVHISTDISLIHPLQY